MSPAAVPARAESGGGKGALVLWAGVLGPPIVFLTDLLVSYGVAYWACSSGRRWALDLVTLVAVALVVVCGVTAWRLLEGSGPADPQGAWPADRTRFMGTVGLASSLLFLLATLGFIVPRLVIGPCYP